MNSCIQGSSAIFVLLTRSFKSLIVVPGSIDTSYRLLLHCSIRKVSIDNFNLDEWIKKSVYFPGECFPQLMQWEDAGKNGTIERLSRRSCDKRRDINDDIRQETSVDRRRYLGSVRYSRRTVVRITSTVPQHVVLVEGELNFLTHWLNPG